MLKRALVIGAATAMLGCPEQGVPSGFCHDGVKNLAGETESVPIPATVKVSVPAAAYGEAFVQESIDGVAVGHPLGEDRFVDHIKASSGVMWLVNDSSRRLYFVLESLCGDVAWERENGEGGTLHAGVPEVFDVEPGDVGESTRVAVMLTLVEEDAESADNND